MAQIICVYPELCVTLHGGSGHSIWARICVLYYQGFVWKQLPHYPPPILSPCPNMSSLESLKHHHFMDKSRLRGGDVSKINTLCHHNVRKEHIYLLGSAKDVVVRYKSDNASKCIALQLLLRELFSPVLSSEKWFLWESLSFREAIVRNARIL